MLVTSFLLDVGCGPKEGLQDRRRGTRWGVAGETRGKTESERARQAMVGRRSGRGGIESGQIPGAVSKAVGD